MNPLALNMYAEIRRRPLAYVAALMLVELEPVEDPATCPTQWDEAQECVTELPLAA